MKLRTKNRRYICHTRDGLTGGPAQIGEMRITGGPAQIGWRADGSGHTSDGFGRRVVGTSESRRSSHPTAARSTGGHPRQGRHAEALSPPRLTPYISDTKEREDLVGSPMHVAVEVTPVKQAAIRGGGAAGGCQR